MFQNSMSDDTKNELNRIHVLSIAEGFFHSSILFALLKLNVFELIGDGSRTLPDLSKQLGVKAETLERLLNAGVALKLLEFSGVNEYKVAFECREVLLPSAGENYLGNFIRNMDYLYLALSRLDEAIVKSGPTVKPEAILGEDKALTEEFVLAMHNNASHHGRELSHFLDTGDCRTMLDLGCGPGTYAFHLGLLNQGLKIFLTDLPDILEIAKKIQTKFSIKNEVVYLPLNAITDEIPGTYDLILVSNTLHMLGERESRKLIKKLYKSINTGGSLVIQAQFLRDDRMTDKWPIFMDLVQLCVTKEGRNHSVKETRQWLKDSGFGDIEYKTMSVFNTNSFLRGYKV